MWIIKVINECRGWADYIGSDYHYQCRPDIIRGWDSWLEAIIARNKLITTLNLRDITDIVFYEASP